MFTSWTHNDYLNSKQLILTYKNLQSYDLFASKFADILPVFYFSSDNGNKDAVVGRKKMAEKNKLAPEREVKGIERFLQCAVPVQRTKWYSERAASFKTENVTTRGFNGNRMSSIFVYVSPSKWKSFFCCHSLKCLHLFLLCARKLVVFHETIEMW